MATIRDREATIKTAIVEIKALTVGGKQVTQSLFRQLQEESIVDGDTMQFRGIPWGRVNYHFDGCVDGGRHLHVVWQQNDELRRSCIFQDGWGRIAYGWQKQADRWLHLAVCNLCREVEPMVGGKPISEALMRNIGDFQIEYDDILLPGSRLTCQIRSSIRFYWIAKRNDRRPDIAWKRASEDIQNELGDDWDTWHVRFCLERHNQAALREANVRSEWEKLYTSLSKLDQLFIAV